MGWTIQGLIDSDMTIEACDRDDCRFRKTLDLETLKARLGPDAPAMSFDLKPKLYCSQCRGKRITLIYSPASNDKRGWGGSHNRG